MAILKSIDTPQGVSASYHKITAVGLDVRLSTMNIEVSMYASESARDTGAIPLWVSTVRIPFEDFASNPLQFFYGFLEQSDKSVLKDGVGDETPGQSEFVLATSTNGAQN